MPNPQPTHPYEHLLLCRTLVERNLASLEYQHLRDRTPLTLDPEYRTWSTVYEWLSAEMEAQWPAFKLHRRNLYLDQFLHPDRP